ncbi:PDZ domain-containing protein [Mucilaginibacter sp. dw_454]|uniref:M61 family metallopeptidase n=1 Tax=Mucilaginibacter sp. dw_454 TaxID=2720079 RepID=UPI001BD628AB|nr:PDZ domain-containing protein [Mucilaginibacter sp. dw_454]
MKKLLLVAAFTGCMADAFAQAPQKPIYYSISFPNAAHHEAEVSITLSPAQDGPIELHMSRSSAGRYATHEFGKNVYNVKAANGDGAPLVVKQTAGDEYVIAEHDKVVKITYTLYANWTDGTYAGIDQSHAHLNMPAAFMWVAGASEKRPVRFEFNDLDKYGWKVATQLKHEGANIYSAPDLQYMMDSPTELSNFKETHWDVTNTDGKTERINLTIHSNDEQATIDNFGKQVQKVVLEEKAVYGELPTYDYGEYTFLDDVYPTNSGDGMEHRNSTCIVDMDNKVAGNEIGLLSTFAHEYFHSWNVKRIRPKSLEPFNFDHANMSNELWFAEGFTQYYGELLLVRAGFHNVDDYAGTLSGLVNSVLNGPGALQYSATQASRDAVFTDAGVAIDPTNYTNTFTSYYYYGGAIALALDLRLRSDFNLTLDDYMRTVWLARGKVMKPYTVADLQTDLGKVTKNPKFAAEFFDKYINGIDKNNYETLLAKAGLVLRKHAAGKPWIGLTVYGRGTAVHGVGNGLALAYPSSIGTPAYKAGLDAGDVITKADGKDIPDSYTMSTVVNAKKPGDKIAITYTNRSGVHETTITVEESPALEVLTFEKAGLTPSADQLAFRNSWLSSKVK